MNDRSDGIDVTAKTASACVEVNAAIEVAWELVANIDGLANHSPECTSTDWVHGFSSPSVGARFTGTNERGGQQWETECTITALDPPHLFAFAAALSDDGTYFAKWTYELTGNHKLTVITESAHAPSLTNPERIQALTEMIRATLASIKADAELTDDRTEGI